MKLSIVTVCYNAENVIERTLKSVLAQTRPVYEYIVIDGGSKDRTYEIVTSYDQEFQNAGIKYFHLSEKDKGISDAFNKGISYATGDVIGLINADDELLPDTNKILNKYDSRYKADIYYGNCIWKTPSYEYVSKPKHNLEDLVYNMVLIHPSTFVKKTAYQECGVFDISLKYCMDKELLYRMYKNGKKFQYVNKELTYFKAGGVSDTNFKAVFREGSQIALQYGEPVYKVKLIEYKKIMREYVVRFVKKTPVFKMIKRIHS